MEAENDLIHRIRTLEIAQDVQTNLLGSLANRVYTLEEENKKIIERVAKLERGPGAGQPY
jgi:hypothetical protein